MSTPVKTTWSRGNLETLDTCPACLHKHQPVQTYHRHDDENEMPDTWHTHVCAHCHSVYLNPRPDKASLPAAYENYLTHQAENPEPVLTNPNTLWSLIRGYLSWRFGLKTGLPALKAGICIRLIPPLRLKLDRFGRHLSRQRFPHGGKLLDVGCGNGGFLSLARQMGWQVSGLEPDPKAAAICASRGIEVIADDIAKLGGQSERFDVITLGDVVEHLLSPKETLQDCFNLLAPGGMIWIATPNPEAYSLGFFGPAWHNLHPPYHVCIPSKRALGHWLTEVGFENVEFIKRGFYSKANWKKCLELESAQLSPKRGVLAKAVFRIFLEVYSWIKEAKGEEIVCVARRPGLKGN